MVRNHLINSFVIISELISEQVHILMNKGCV